jgi:hypothetical protein
LGGHRRRRRGRRGGRRRPRGREQHCWEVEVSSQEEEYEEAGRGRASTRLRVLGCEEVDGPSLCPSSPLASCPHTAMLILLPSSISIHQAKVKSYGFRPGTTKRDLIIVLLRVWDALHLPPPSSPSAVSSTSKESAPDSDAPLASQSAPSTSRSRPTTASKKPRAKKQQQTLDPSTAAEEAEEPDEEFAGLFDDVGNGGEGNLSDASSSVPLASKRPSKPVKATTKAESRAAPKKQMKAVEDVEEEEEEVGATGKGSVDLPTVFKAMIQDEEDLWLRVLRYEVRFFLSLLFYLLVPPSELRADSAVILSSFSLSRSSPSTSKSSFRARFDEASRPRGGRRV